MSMKLVYVVVCVASLASVPAWAGSPYTVSPAREPPVSDPSASGMPNVPNLQGCVAWCRRDLNPCDPPIYKQADGRCDFPD